MHEESTDSLYEQIDKLTKENTEQREFQDENDAFIKNVDTQIKKTLEELGVVDPVPCCSQFVDHVDMLCDAAKSLKQELLKLAEDFANPKLLDMRIEKNIAEISVKPRLEIMKYLFKMCAHALGDAPNFIQCVFGPHPNTGKSYELTLRDYDGKTPSQHFQEREKEFVKLLDEVADKLCDTRSIFPWKKDDCGYCLSCRSRILSEKIKKTYLNKGDIESADRV